MTFFFLSLLLAFLLFPGQCLLSLFFLYRDEVMKRKCKRLSAMHNNRIIIRKFKIYLKKLTACLVDLPPALRSFSFFSCFSYCFRSSFCFCTYIFLNVTANRCGFKKYYSSESLLIHILLVSILKKKNPSILSLTIVAPVVIEFLVV